MDKSRPATPGTVFLQAHGTGPFRLHGPGGAHRLYAGWEFFPLQSGSAENAGRRRHVSKQNVMEYFPMIMIVIPMKKCRKIVEQELRTSSEACEGWGGAGGRGQVSLSLWLLAAPKLRPFFCSFKFREARGPWPLGPTRPHALVRVHFAGTPRWSPWAMRGTTTRPGRRATTLSAEK